MRIGIDDVPGLLEVLVGWPTQARASIGHQSGNWPTADSCDDCVAAIAGVSSRPSVVTSLKALVRQ